jgi:hypothetical protein
MKYLFALMIGIGLLWTSYDGAWAKESPLTDPSSRYGKPTAQGYAHPEFCPLNCTCVAGGGDCFDLTCGLCPADDDDPGHL